MADRLLDIKKANVSYNPRVIRAWRNIT